MVWKPPNYDGGSAISHYIVEHEIVKTEWSTAANARVKKTEYSLQVKKSETYTVRVTAVNKLGVGEPVFITVKFTGQYEIEGVVECSFLRLVHKGTCIGLVLYPASMAV